MPRKKRNIQITEEQTDLVHQTISGIKLIAQGDALLDAYEKLTDKGVLHIDDLLEESCSKYEAGILLRPDNLNLSIDKIAVNLKKLAKY